MHDRGPTEPNDNPLALRIAAALPLVVMFVILVIAPSLNDRDFPIITGALVFTLALGATAVANHLLNVRQHRSASSDR